MTKLSAEVFISYAWDEQSQAIVALLEKQLGGMGLRIVRDVTPDEGIGYKGLIKDFMDRIGNGSYVIMVISDRYLRSRNCMYELTRIAAKGDFYDRVFPIVMEDAKFYAVIDRLKYAKHWESQVAELDEAIKSMERGTDLTEAQQELNLFAEFRAKIMKLASMLAGMNTLSEAMHRKDNFNQLYEKIREKMVAAASAVKPDDQVLKELKKQVQDESYRYDIFLSFSSKDHVEMEKVGAELRSYGLRVFISSEALRGEAGHGSFSKLIEAGLRESRHFVLLCTPNAMKSEWVEREYHAFFDHIHRLAPESRLFFILRGSHFRDDLVPLLYRNIQQAYAVKDIAVRLSRVLPMAKPAEPVPPKREELSGAEKAELARLRALEAELKEKAAAEQAKKATAEAERRRQEEEAKKAFFVETVKGVSFRMIRVEGGSFEMGDVMGDNEWDNEKPVHRVTLSSYHIGETPVTQAFWKAVMGDNPSHFKGNDDCPVECVSWDDIVHKFLPRLNHLTGKKYRLPTEAEWEYAARERGRKVRFGNGKDVADPREMNFCGLAEYKKPYSVEGVYRGETTPVKSFSPNGLGLYDMSGNVWEWCSDWYGSYPSTAQTNPQGPATGSTRVFRGGGWRLNPQHARVAFRFQSTPTFRSYSLGFRLALPL